MHNYWENKIEIEVIKCIDCDTNEKMMWETENEKQLINTAKRNITFLSFIKKHKCQEGEK